MLQNKKAIIILKAIGWSQSYGTNWCYRYYDLTIVSNDLDLLPLQGIYEDTFGSVTNDLRYFRDIKDIDFIEDNHLSECKQSRNRMKRLLKGTDLKMIFAILNK